LFHLFTDRSRRVIVLAQEEARMLQHRSTGTGHILLGLIHDGTGVSAEAFEVLHISLEAARQQVEKIIGRGPTLPTGDLPFTPRARTVLELSLRESRRHGQESIRPEHILLGLVREGTGVGTQVLLNLGASMVRVHETVMQIW
jgi:ATP-dependent Clp protease ATP-binding subunit ClpC